MLTSSTSGFQINLQQYFYIIVIQVGEFYTLRRFAYNNTTELTSLRKLVDKAFPHPMPKHRAVAIRVEEMISCLEIKEECVSTLICYLEQRGLLEIIRDVKDTCTIKCFGEYTLKDLAKKCPALDMAIRMKGNYYNI